MSAVKDVNQSDFQKEVLDASKNKPVLIDFWAPWCGPCRVQGPIVDELAAETDKAIILKMNVDENIDLSNQYQIFSIPTIMVFRNGAMVENIAGVQSKAQLTAMIERYI